ncbi:uncharacterized protein [Acropora muricata]|uniref:uncharacterized protein isoform X1 n=1 Tax=Acropora muricata TaxID=159855 RepID=UPI0034E37DBC
MAEVTEDNLASSESESTSGVAGSSESIDLSCIHWGYLNCTQLTDPKKIKDCIWRTYWADLCGSTIRLYRDLSLPPDSANHLPSSSLIGPSNENEKKEAFIVLKKGTQVSIVEAGYEPRKSRKRLTVNRRHVFRVFFVGQGSSSQALSYLFQAPTKGAMYRWISKVEQGIEIADKPQNEGATVASVLTSAITYFRGFSLNKRLKEAKLLSMEQRRYQVIPEMRFPDKDDIDSGMEGDVEEVYESSKKFAENPHLENLKKRLREMEDLVLQLDKEEMAFLGSNDTKLLRRVRFESRTSKDYLLIPGHPRTLIPKGTDVTILGQLSHHRWRCFVDLPKKSCVTLANGDRSQSETSSEVGSILSEDISEEEGIPNANSNTETLIGSVPTSALVEFSRLSQHKPEDGTPTASPEDTPQLSPFPSPPHSPCVSRRSSMGSFPNNRRSSLRRSIASENLSEQDIWEQFCIPSPPSSPATSRSTSLSLSSSLVGSLDDFDVDQAARNEEKNGNEQTGNENLGNDRMGSGDNVDDVPETYIGSDSEDDRMVTVIDEVPPHETIEEKSYANVTVKMRPKKERRPRNFDDEIPGGLYPNYAFLVTKKLRQRGISLIVGSSSSDDEVNEDQDQGKSSKLSLGRLGEQFSRYEEASQNGLGVRPYSAFVPMKRASITLSTGSNNVTLRKSTRDELLRDYSSPLEKSPTIHTNTCTTIEQLGNWSSTENAPPVNQRRTLQLCKNSTSGFGFTLQTYGIVQQDGNVDYMTFVLSVEEDGPAYMAGLRPGDVILEADGKNVEEEEHKAIVTMIHSASESIRLVVVFVDALRRMKLNTRLKLLQAQLAAKEREFEELSKTEEDVVKGNGCSSLDLSFSKLKRERTNSYLYTTELTSSFAKKSSEVHDSLHQYRQQFHDTRPARPCSVPDESNLGKQRITATTDLGLLKKFSSPDLSSNRIKPASNKLMKSFRKKKPSVESFKSYVELDLDQNVETVGSPSCPSVFESSKGLPTKDSNTDFMRSSSESDVPTPDNWTSCNGKANSLSPVTKTSLSPIRNSSEHSGLTNGSRSASGMPNTRQRSEKSSPGRKLPQIPSKPKYGTNGSSSLQRPDLLRTKQQTRPDSYLLAMDSAGDSPLIPRQRTLRGGNGFSGK